MPAVCVRCPVLRDDVTRIVDLEGEPLAIICAEYQEPTKTCRLKLNALDEGPLSQLLERVEEHRIGSRSTQCDLS